MNQQSEEFWREFFPHSPVKETRAPIKSGWNISRLVQGKPLTDRKINAYAKRGWYSEEFREGRRKLMRQKQSKREGSFVKDGDRLIYSPL